MSQKQNSHEMFGSTKTCHHQKLCTVPQFGKVMLILILTPKPLFFSMGYLKSKLCMVVGSRGHPEVLIKQWF